MQIKKYTSLFLAILLLVSNFGLAFNVHYCGNKIAAVSSVFSTIKSTENIISSNKDCCCVKDGDSKSTCCKNKVVDLKKDTKDVIVKTFSFQIDLPFLILKSTNLVFSKAEKVLLNSNLTEYYCSPNAPPLFKLYHQYIFYA